MAISFVAASSVYTGVSPNVSLPVGYAAGDMLFIVCTSTSTPSDISGWTKLAQNAGQYITIYYKTASSSEFTPVAVPVFSSTSKTVVLAYRDMGSLDVLGSFSIGTSTSATTTSLTTTTNNDFVLSIYACTNSTATFTEPTSTNSRVNSASTNLVKGLLIVDELQATADATTTRTATLSASRAWSAVGVSFKPYVAPSSNGLFFGSNF